jgi:hypothetical protein
LIRAADQAVTYLQHRLPAVAQNDVKRVTELVGALDDDRFEVRERATNELVERGAIVVPVLRKELQRQLPSLEVRRRLERVLEKLPLEVLERHRAREQRAVQVLERIRSPSSEQVLKQWARGASSAPLTRDALAASDRLGKPRSWP